jgi:hypothetical protein
MKYMEIQITDKWFFYNNYGIVTKNSQTYSTLILRDFESLTYHIYRWLCNYWQRFMLFVANILFHEIHNIHIFLFYKTEEKKWVDEKKYSTVFASISPISYRIEILIIYLQEK